MPGRAIPPIRTSGRITSYTNMAGEMMYSSRGARLMGFRVGRPTAFNVTVDAGNIIRAGAWQAVLSQTLPLAAFQAALTSGQARYVLIALDSTGVATSTPGAIVAVGALDISDCPIPAAGEIPLAAVRLYGTQTSIGDVPTAPDIVNLRFPQASSTGTVFLSTLQPGTAQYQIITSGTESLPGNLVRLFHSRLGEPDLHIPKCDGYSSAWHWCSHPCRVLERREHSWQRWKFHSLYHQPDRRQCDGFYTLCYVWRRKYCQT